MTLASVILCNYNGMRIAHVLRNSVESVLQQTYGDLELILVDDGSTDGSPAFLQELAAADPRARFVSTGWNRGIAAARNAGLSSARGAYLAFLDNDAIPARDWLSILVERLRSDRAIGACASRVMFADRPDIVDSVGSVLNRLAYGTNVGMHELAEFLELPQELMYATGNGMAVRREAIEKVGLFDEGYHRYGEDDSDMGVRLRAAGYRIVPEPRALISHLHGYSRTHPGMTFWEERNRIRFVLKHYTWYEWPRFAIGELLSHNRSALRAYAAAWLSNLTSRRDLAPLLRYRWEHRRDGSFLARQAPFMDSVHGYLVRPDNRTPGPAGFPPLGGLEIGVDDQPYLYQGWYSPEPLKHTRLRFRWARRVASLSFRLEEPADRLEMQTLVPPRGGGRLQAQLRQQDGTAWRVTGQAHWQLAPQPFARQRLVFPGPIEPGNYRLLLLADKAFREGGETPRELALGLISLAAQ